MFRQTFGSDWLLTTVTLQILEDFRQQLSINLVKKIAKWLKNHLTQHETLSLLFKFNFLKVVSIHVDNILFNFTMNDTLNSI